MLERSTEILLSYSFSHGMLTGVKLKIYDRVTAPDQDDTLFIIQFSYLVQCHKLFAVLSSGEFNFSCIYFDVVA
ncbi:hypothetical protein D5281_10020 [bacterium 1xD42-62]|uniref:Uncharacterized protein n=1 Tax=Parablautia muri TaxID=2320879 RepID=A0A9X5BFX7_9FIRM|nr:hypothetical protein [Parablautia muri]